MRTSPGTRNSAASRSTGSGEWKPGIVSWNITRRCNLRCAHCYLNAGEGGTAELSFEEGCQLIDQLAARGTRMLILTGGEPLMRRDTARLASYASSKGIMVVLGTNGTLITDSLARELKAVGIGGVGISLDSLVPEKHDGFRGVQGAWEGAVRGIRLCVSLGLPVLVQMTVLPWNYGEVADMTEFAFREGAVGFNLYFLVCTGRGEELSDITPEQYEQALAYLVQAQQRYPSMMVRARCAPQVSRLAGQVGSALVGSAGCLAGRDYCRVTPEGDVTPCPYLPLVAGNVREQPFMELWDNAVPFRRLREEPLTGRCGSCEFNDVCSGCRARALALTGDLLAADPWCTYQPSHNASVRSVHPVAWSADAEQRLQRIPSFIRERVRVAVEGYAQAQGEDVISPPVMKAALESLGRSLPFRRPQGLAVTDSPDQT